MNLLVAEVRYYSGQRLPASTWLPVVVRVFGYNRMKVGEQLNAESAGNAKLRDSLRVAQASGLDSLGQSLGRAGELSMQLQPA